jgi:hypothetical protein
MFFLLENLLEKENHYTPDERIESYETPPSSVTLDIDDLRRGARPSATPTL